MADFVAEVAEEGGRLCLGAEHEPWPWGGLRWRPSTRPAWP